MLKKISAGLILAIILTVNIFRFCWLDQAPQGFNVDEMAGAVSIACLQTQGTDAHLIPHPVFFEQHYGTPKPPVYAYPAAWWATIFGHTVDKFRAFTAFFCVLSLIGLYFLARLKINSIYALLTVLLASLSPWLWNLSRIGYESTFCVTFSVWGIYFFIRSNSLKDKIISAFLFSCAAYSYPPARLAIPFLLLSLIILSIKEHKITKQGFIAFSVALLIPSLPLIHGTLFGNLQHRFKDISIFNDVYLHSIVKTKSIMDLAGIFFQNYFSHFSIDYLFIHGDPSPEHGMQITGNLGWLEILGLISFVGFLLFKFKKFVPYRHWLLFLIFNFFISFIPASLTQGGLPSNLRTFMGFPFAELICAFGLWLLIDKFKHLIWGIILLGAFFSFIYLKHYFTIYPNESKGWFSYWTKKEALNAKTDEDWINFMLQYQHEDYHFRYYLMNYRHETCSDSRAKWLKMREMLGLSKPY